MAGGLTASIARIVREAATRWTQTTPSVQEADALLRYMTKWRSQVLANTFVSRHGARILNGPFKGMTYLEEVAEGSFFARLIGTYEACLHPHLAEIIGEGLDCVIDVGCAEGYYAVGLAYAHPGLTVHARDISEPARSLCAKLAAINGVADRVIIGGEFRPEDFQAFAGQRVLALVDIEGAEIELLKPERAAALAQMALIVETHDQGEPRILQDLIARFTPTHHVQRVDRVLKDVTLPDWMQGLGEFDQLLAHWEWRYRPTPWLVMRPRAGLPPAS